MGRAPNVSSEISDDTPQHTHCPRDLSHAPRINPMAGSQLGGRKEGQRFVPIKSL